MARPTRALCLCLLVVLAGCGSAATDPTPTEGTASPTATPEPPTTTAAATTTATATPTPTPEPTPSRDELAAEYGPWLGDPVAVYVEPPDGGSVTANVRNATRYWEDNAERYAGYAVDYTLTENRSRADVVVEVRPSLSVCGDSYDDRFLGCAELLDGGAPAPDQVTVYVVAGLSERELNVTLTHEFGHTLGLDHRSTPAVMRPELSLSYPNVSERANPWNRETITVYVDLSAYGKDGERFRDQVDRALAWYEDGAFGSLDADVEFETVDERARANVVVEGRPIAGGTASTTESLWGYDVDDDPALEYYDTQRLVIDEGLDIDAVGWHVAAQLGVSFFTGRPQPAVLNSTDYHERRSAWWRE